jgi:hypothetical protein
MRLAIVGSRQLWGSRPAAEAICHIIEEWRPTVVVSGGAIGIDKMGVHLAKFIYKLAIKEYLPQVQQFEDHGLLKGFRSRDLLIAENCDALLRVVWAGTKSYGSGWTRDRAKERGVPTLEVRVERAEEEVMRSMWGKRR